MDFVVFFNQKKKKKRKGLQPTNSNGFYDVFQRTKKKKGLVSVTHNIVAASKDQLTNQCRKFKGPL